MPPALTHNQFVSKAIENHGKNVLDLISVKSNNVFEYLSEYENNRTMLKIKCIKHDIVFENASSSHLRTESGGCPLCQSENMSDIKSTFKKSDPECEQKIKDRDKLQHEKHILM